MDGSPQRPPLRLRVPAPILGVVSLLVLAGALVPTASAQTGFVTNGDFEDGLNGWSPTAGASAGVDASTGGVAGPSAALVSAETPGLVQLRSSWWLNPQIIPGAAFGLEAWILDNSPDVTVSLVLEFLDEHGTRMERSAPSALSGDSDAYRVLLVQEVAPPGAAYARAVVEANADVPGASFHVDAVTLAQVGAAPVVTPTVQPPPSPTPSPAATPRVTGTPRGTPTPTRTPVARPIAPVLWNANFEDGTNGWEATRGSLEVAPGLGGVVLRANNASTAWVEQAVTVVPGSWYAASAVLAPVEGVRAAWVRIAWYASDDASGAQMSTDDSEAISVEGLAILVGPGAPVTTGPVQAPVTARSARVRILLQPSADAGAVLAITGVAFEASQKPASTPTPTPTASPTPAATASPPVTPSATPVVAASSGSGRPRPSAPTQARSAVDADLEGQALLRITEVLADPIQPGRDADYEWVELTNLGTRSVDIEAMLLRDPQQATPLASLVVAPGASVVIGAALAEVDADARVEGSLGNGLGNEGDRVELLDASGRVVDALDYGSGADLTVTPGEAVHRWFDVSGLLLGTGVGPPSPGEHGPIDPSVGASATGDAGDEASVAASGETETSESERSSEGPDSMAWMLLIAVGGGALGGVAAQRIGRS